MGRNDPRRQTGRQGLRRESAQHARILNSSFFHLPRPDLQRDQMRLAELLQLNPIEIASRILARVGVERGADDRLQIWTADGCFGRFYIFQSGYSVGREVRKS